MPWQIIPIESSVPFDIDCYGYNVSIFIPTANIEVLKNKVQNLLSNCQFLLFLRANNIDIKFVVGEVNILSVRKHKEKDVISLFVNDNEDSCWLVHAEDISVDKSDEFQVRLQDDINTPDKLKESTTFDLTFAILINGKSIQPLKESKIYTYLPTSETMEFPFLVNANFITDAGRQQLHKDSVWNQMIFSKIPYTFLNWISTISREYSNYYDILPKRHGYGNDNLSTILCQELDRAIKDVAFIPSLTENVLLKSGDAIIDKVDIGDVVADAKLVAHINRQTKANYSTDGFIANRGAKILSSYGVYVFGVKELSSLLEDKYIFAELTVEENAGIIFYLFELYNSFNIQDKHALIEKLSTTSFLLADDNSVMAPNSLYFPSKYYEENSLAGDERLLNDDLYAIISERIGIIQWLESLGVQELSDISFIRNRICSRYFITKDNAIDVGRFLFEKRDVLFKNVGDSDLSKLKFITKRGQLKNASELYFSREYEPKLDIEDICDNDAFVSDQYVDNNNWLEWKSFFVRLGVNDDIAIKTLNFKEGSEIANLLPEQIATARNTLKNWSPLCQRDFSVQRIDGIFVKYVPLLSVQNTSHSFSRYVWSIILSQPISLTCKDDYIQCDTGKNYKAYGYLYDEEYLGTNFLKWVIKYHQTLPASTQEMRLASTMYINSETNKRIAGRFLPVIDVDCVIDDSWLDILNLKQKLGLSEYLEILTKISYDSHNIEQNKDCIKEIYKLIVEEEYIHNKQTQISEWAKSNKILSSNGEFVHPKDLSYITIDGFSLSGRIYTGDLPIRSDDSYLELLSLLGVRVITEKNISPEFSNKRGDDNFRSKLQEKLTVIALLKAGETPTQKEYDKCLRDIGKRINQTTFYQCDSISLSYGDENDCIDKKTFTMDGSFYYVGDLRPANIVPLLTPLCKYLGLGKLEQELFIVFFENIDGIRMYLKDKEYNVEFIKDHVSGTGAIFDIHRPATYDISDSEQRIIDGARGEIFVYEYLRSLGYEVSCPQISTVDDYDKIIQVKGEAYYYKTCYQSLDMVIKKDDKPIYIEVKSTRFGKDQTSNMPISYSEISKINQCFKQGEQYIIVRVYDVETESPEFYFLNGTPELKTYRE